MKKKTLKVFTFFAAVLILTSAASYFFINGYIYPLIITSTKKIINELTGGETEIGKVELSIFPPSLEMTEITFSLEGEKKTSFQLKKISAKLNPIQALSGTINISKISIVEPEIDIFIKDLPKKKSKSDAVKDKLQPDFFKANIHKLNLEKGHFIVRISKDEFIEINNVNGSMTKADTGDDILTISTSTGRIAFKGGQEDLGNIKLEGTRKDSEIIIHNISISPQWGTLSGSLMAGLKPSIYVKGDIKGKIPFNRFSPYIKKGLPAKGEAHLRASYSYKNNKADLKATFEYSKKNRPLELNASLSILPQGYKVRKAKLVAANLSADMEGSILKGNRLDLRTRFSFQNLSAISSSFISPAPKGSIESEGKIEGTLSKPEFKTSIKALNIAYGKYKAHEVTGMLNYTNRKLWSDEIKITGKNVSFTTDGSLSFPEGAPVNSDLTVNIPPSPMQNLLALIGEDLPIEGELESQLKIAGNINNPNVKGKLSINKGTFFNEKADILKLSGEYKNKTLSLEELFIQKEQALFTAQGTIPTEDEINIDFEAKNIAIEKINHIENKAAGIVNVKGKVEGQLLSPIVKADLTARQLKSDRSNISANMEGNLYAKINTSDLHKQMISYNSGKLQIILSEEKRISLTPFTMKFEKELFSFSRTSFSDHFGSISMKGSLDLKGNSNISLKAVAELEGLESKLKGVEDIEGRVDVNVRIRGNIKKPLMKGTINAKKGLVRFKGFPYDMYNINGKLNLTGNKITVSSLKGQLEGSDFTGGGHLVFDGYLPSEIKLYFDVNEVDLTIPRWLPSRSKGRMTVSAIGKEVTLGGDIDVLRASYTDEVDFKSFLTKLINVTDRKMIDKEEKKEAEEDDLNVKIRFRADDNLIIKNNLGNMELKGDLILTGKGSNLSIVGNLETIGGKGYFRNREFLIRKGTVDFTNREQIIPIVNIDAETTIKDYLVNVNVAGPPKDLVFTLNSDPPLEEKEIVSLVTFGYTGSELRGQGTELTSLGAASLIFQEDIESKIKQYFGFDRLRIEPYYSETAETTEARITLDKDLGKRTTATYSRGMSTLDEEVKVEYKLDNHLSFEGSWASTEETVGAFGGDVILRFEFE